MHGTCKNIAMNSMTLKKIGAFQAHLIANTHMRKHIQSLAFGVALLGAVTSASAVGLPALNITLQDAGNGQTTISLSGNPYFISSGASVSSTTVHGVSSLDPVFSGWINNLGAYTAQIPVSGFGTFNNPNGVADGGTASAQLGGIQLVAAGGSSFLLELSLVSTLGVAQGNRVTYAPATDSAIIDVPISIFNPGTYSYAETAGTGGFGQINYNLTVVQAVPEPSTWAFLGSGLIGLLMFQRRKS
jgi:hypothetical protein